MLKDNPEMLKIYPGIENKLLEGAIDCHIRALLAFGIKEDEVRLMLHDNPAKLMWLD